MRFGSVCSGIEAASVAWHPLGWQTAWLAEIEPFPAAVLAHHYPEVPNLGDMTALPTRIRSGEIEAPDVFCGGTPCQAFSVAGMRRSLDDARGNLSLTFCEIADAIDDKRNEHNEPATIIFWENVPGVLSTRDNAFGCFLAGLAGEDAPLEPSGGKWTDAGVVIGPARAVAWRTLDAQYFGLAQRRRRVFVVASARAGFDPAAVLFEFEGVRRDTAPSREAGERVAPTIAGCANGGGANGPGRDVDSVESLQVAQPYAGAQRTYTNEGSVFQLRNVVGQPVAFHESQRAEITLNDTAGSLTVGGGKPGQGYPAVLVPTLTASNDPSRSPQSSEVTAQVAQPYAGFESGIDFQNVADTGDVCGTLMGEAQKKGGQAGHGVLTQPYTVANCLTQRMHKGINTTLDEGQTPVLAFHPTQDPISSENVCRSIGANKNATAAVAQVDMQVRRLTPVECERLQGFPDGYTNIAWRGKRESPDGPRYKALGNSWAVPVVRWIGARIQLEAMK